MSGVNIGCGQANKPELAEACSPAHSLYGYVALSATPKC